MVLQGPYVGRAGHVPDTSSARLAWEGERTNRLEPRTEIEGAASRLGVVKPWSATSSTTRGMSPGRAAGALETRRKQFLHLSLPSVSSSIGNSASPCNEPIDYWGFESHSNTPLSGWLADGARSPGEVRVPAGWRGRACLSLSLP